LPLPVVLTEQLGGNTVIYGSLSAQQPLVVQVVGQSQLKRGGTDLAGMLVKDGMRNHPLTPMTEAKLVRVLQQQVKGQVGLVEQATVARGDTAIRERFAALKSAGCNLAVVHAISDADLIAIGAAWWKSPWPPSPRAWSIRASAN
jgi:uncharacterized protein YgbK (DUF1537 family)